MAGFDGIGDTPYENPPVAVYAVAAGCGAATVFAAAIAVAAGVVAAVEEVRKPVHRP